MTVDQVPPDVPAMRSLTQALAAPLQGAYRVGGFGLVFVILGATLLASSGFYSSSPIRYTSLTLGTLLISFTCYFFYVKEIKPINQARQAIDSNKEILNELQQAAISAAQLGLMLQSVVYKHSQDVNAVINVTRTQLRRIPFGLAQQIADQPILVNADALAAGVVTISERAEEVFREINAAIVASDATRLRKFINEAEVLKSSIRRFLAAGTELTADDSGQVDPNTQSPA